MKFNKRGVTSLVFYALLVGAFVFFSFIAFVVVKAYGPPVKTQECPEGVSLFIQKAQCFKQGDQYLLNVSVKNNGRFNVGGYIILGSNSEIKYFYMDAVDTQGVVLGGQIFQKSLDSGVKFLGAHSSTKNVSVNPLEVEQTIDTSFYSDFDINSFEVVPVRWQGDKSRLAVCNLAKTIKRVECIE